tara:strand:- start:5290 stop:7326 length:2037 start_codon:yes stop_codon:yes gene_type:complete
MNVKSKLGIWKASVAAILGTCSVAAHAELNINFSHFVRVDSAYRTTSKQNLNNQRTNSFNNRTAPRQAYVPPNIVSLNSPLGVVTGAGETSGNDWNVPLPGFSDPVTRGEYIRDGEQELSYLSLRLESEMQVKFNRNFRFIGRVRAAYDPGLYSDTFDPGSDILQDPAGNGLIGAGGRAEIYESEPNYYEAIGRNGRNVNPLEFAHENYMVDFPALMFEYKTGNLTMRVGNQQIAWGQALLFQTLDVPNGLDLRRHSLLDRGFEEFSDKRVPRLTFRTTHQWKSLVTDFYVSKFQPTILGNANTPYNVIPTQFTVQENYYSGGYDNKIDGGIRFKADYGSWGWQAVFASRYNPLGTFRWAATGVVTELDQASTFGLAASTAYAVKLPGCDGVQNPAICRNSDSVGEALAKTPFAAQPGGVLSADEWFTYAADVRLDGVDGLNQALLGFPDLRDIYVTLSDSYEESYNQLNSLFIASQSFRGFIEREYHRESVFGLGGVYITEAENEWLNQIIFNLEAQYTPDRVFTQKGLGVNFLEKDEYILSLVVEKWTRWSEYFPAAYLVGQFQHRSESDIVGRHLSGYGGTPTGVPDGIPNSNYVVLAALQPWPERKYILEFATLIDTRGGVLIQPLVQWNVGSGIIAEFYYNYVQGHAWGKPTDNFLDTADWADELAMRVKFQF